MQLVTLLDALQLLVFQNLSCSFAVGTQYCERNKEIADAGTCVTVHVGRRCMVRTQSAGTRATGNRRPAGSYAEQTAKASFSQWSVGIQYRSRSPALFQRLFPLLSTEALLPPSAQFP
jgi:hypothetical protein